MIKALIVDINVSFLEDISRTMMIDERTDIEVFSENNINNVDKKVLDYKPDVIVLSAKVCESRDWNFNIPVRTYARNVKDMELANKQNLKCYGVVSRSAHLLDAIVKDTTLYNDVNDSTDILTAEDMPEEFRYAFQQGNDGFEDISKKTSNNEVNSSAKNITQETTQNYQQNKQYASSSAQNITQNASQNASQNVDNQNYQLSTRQQQLPYLSETGQGFYDNNGNYIKIYDYTSYNPETDQVETRQYYYDYTSGQWYPYNYPMLEAPKEENINEYVADNIISSGAKKEEQSESRKNVTGILRSKAESNNKRFEEESREKAGILAEREFETDMGNLGKKAQCITVYSAKGGVGKTTLSCEIATFLALTAHNRGKYKVCIADFNIDFGDVMNTLNFDPHGANMTTWAEDIKSRLERGEKPEDITYTKERIMLWLQKNERDGLYALLAPTSNIDSQSIPTEAINIMIDNLLNNCGFDFVVCDTGNNTRDSSFIALENADVVLMILTQTVNAANCNNSFLMTAERLDFDMSKIKLVINKIRPTKAVGISPEELEDAFVNPRTGKPYKFETLAKIKESDDVTNSGNLGTPLVYDSTHEFTKSIGEIVRKLIGEQTVLEEPKKPSFWERLWGKK